jgi:hypothetical protein
MFWVIKSSYVIDPMQRSGMESLPKRLSEGRKKMSRTKADGGPWSAKSSDMKRFQN